MHAKITFLFVWIVLATPFVDAENFKVPSSAFSTDEFEEAKVEAHKKGETISYVFAESHSTCPLHNNAAENALSKLNRGGVVVYVNLEDKSFYKKLPLPIVSAYSSQKAGNYIPKVVSSDADALKILGIMPYQEMKKNKSWDKGYRKSIAQGDDIQERDDKGQAIVKWYLKEKPGRHYKGSFVSLEGEVLTLQMTDGDISRFSIDRFNQASVDFAEAQQAKLLSSNPSKQYQLERWTSNDGKMIQATFVKLEGDEITLETAPGKNQSFNITRLSGESQAHARKLASQE